MTKPIRIALPTLFAVVVSLSFEASSAHAFGEFKKAFEAMYMKKDSAIYSAFDGKTHCNTCHVGKKKKNLNAYGKALSPLMKRKDRKNTEKINAGLIKVAGQASAGEGSPTFGELISTGKLPVTKEEPAK